MNCEKCHSKLIFHLEGSLPETEAREVSLHLESCEACRQFAGFLSNSLASIEMEKHPEADPFFYTRLKARMEARLEAKLEANRETIRDASHEAKWVAMQKAVIQPVWIRIAQPVIISLALAAVIWTGILIGGSERFHPDKELSANSVVPWLNEFESEPFENFLND